MKTSVTSFEKWEGLGNDFVVLSPEAPITLAPERVRAICDRRRGVGADGVLLVEDARGARPRMIVYNADGSRPEMCGNGLRCVAAYLSRGRPGASSEIAVTTDTGEKLCLVQGGPERYDVMVAMGSARFGENLRADVGEIQGTNAREHWFFTVDVGNPHAITFEPYGEAAIDRIGPLVDASVPGGTNVEFCRAHATASGARIEVIVWERGVGRTLACGTGACAVAAAACKTGRASFGAPIIVSLPGGDLEITISAERRDIRMRGPARRVFAGELVDL